MSFRFWIILAVVLFFGWGFYADASIEIARLFAGDSIKSIGDAADWADTFGAFNGLVSLAGAVFVVRTLLLQQAALAEQQKALALQAADAHRQRFEATFFELLKLLRELRSELSFRASKEFIEAASTQRRREIRSTRQSGLQALNAFLADYLTRLKNLYGSIPPTKDQLAKAYDDTMTTDAERTFAPYFRLVYTIINKVHKDSVLKSDEKATYTRLLRSQLTNVELSAIAYNALSPRSADLKDLMTEYRMLKYMPQATGRKRFERLYDRVAFEPRD